MLDRKKCKIINSAGVAGSQRGFFSRESLFFYTLVNKTNLYFFFAVGKKPGFSSECVRVYVEINFAWKKTEKTVSEKKHTHIENGNLVGLYCRGGVYETQNCSCRYLCIRKQRADSEQNLADSQSSTPIILTKLIFFHKSLFFRNKKKTDLSKSSVCVYPINFFKKIHSLLIVGTR